MEKLLVNAVIDILHMENSSFLQSLIRYFNPECEINKFFPDIAQTVLMNVITKVFDDCIMDENVMFYSIKECKPFLSFLVSLIINQSISYVSIRNAITFLRPSLFVEYFIIYITASLNNALTPEKVFKICNDLFKTKWLFNCFRKPEEIPMMLVNTDITMCLPYLQIYGLIHQFLKKSINVNDLIILIKDTGLPSLFESNKMLKSIIDPFIDYLYSNILNNEEKIPYLQMTVKQLNRTKEFLDYFRPIFEEFIKKIDGITLEEQWITSDVRVGRGEEKWLNVLLRRG